MKRNKSLAFVFGGTWLEHLPMAHELIKALKDDGWSIDVYNIPIYDPTVPRSSLATEDAFLKGKIWPWKKTAELMLKRKYSGYIGSCGAGIWCASLWARFTRRPAALFSDEMLDPYSEWHQRERTANRRCAFTLIPDLCRWDYLRQLNGLDVHAKVFELPNSPGQPGVPQDIEKNRRTWGLNKDDICLLSLGGFTEKYGVERFLASIPAVPHDIKIVIHERVVQSPTFRAMADLLSRSYQNLIFSYNIVPYEKVSSLAGSGDIGIALYDSSDPNFKLMGKASGKICYFLANGVPVIYENLDNLHWIREAGAGEPAHSSESIVSALAKITADLQGYKKRAKKVYDNRVRPDRYLEVIVREIARWDKQ